MLLPMMLALTLSSPDVRNGAPIPRTFVWNKNGCNGMNRTPRLRWNAPPPGTRTFDLTVIDHDAPKPGGWVHWIVIHIPASARAIGPAVPRGAVVGKNDFGTLGWGGPCPPPGPAHHYTFVLQAVDANKRTLGSAKMVPIYKR
ncbi:MAG TPA: YbhB/YbcL family Raf kinase inhibitor-like protein [Candidatus Elarobacter sp.]|nr:YbhB/YbcL family Raf kinase inhibitor-like protein [Candidatus Elarobacter sp.]